MKNRILLFMLLSSISLSSFRAGAIEHMYSFQEAPRFKEGRLAFKTLVDSARTDVNFNKEGKKQAIFGNFFKSGNLLLGFEWDTSRYLSLNGSLLFAKSSSLKIGERRENLNIKGLQFGMVNRYWRSLPFLKLAWDARAFIRMHKNPDSSDKAALGDGASWLQVGNWIKTDEDRMLRFWAYTGFKYPLEKLSGNLMYMAFLEFRPLFLRFAAGLVGQQPLVKDSRQDNPVNSLIFFDRSNAGSFYYAGVNSEYLEAQFRAGFSITPYTNFKVGYAATLMGKNYSETSRIFAQLEVSVSTRRGGISFPYKSAKAGEKSGVRHRSRLKDYAKPPVGTPANGEKGPSR